MSNIEQFLVELAALSNKYGVVVTADSLGVRVKDIRASEYIRYYKVDDEAYRDYGVTCIIPYEGNLC